MGMWKVRIILSATRRTATLATLGHTWYRFAAYFYYIYSSVLVPCSKLAPACTVQIFVKKPWEMEPYAKVGRGGAGNYYSSQDIQDAAEKLKEVRTEAFNECTGY